MAVNITGNNVDLGGNAITASVLQVGADTGGQGGAATTVGIYSGTANPPTFSATKGSLFICTAGSGVANRMFINTNGTTGWTNFTTAA